MGRPKIDTPETRNLEAVVLDKPTTDRAEWIPQYHRAVRQCLAAGISPYKIGVLTGNTSSIARRRLIEKATEQNGEQA